MRRIFLAAVAMAGWLTLTTLGASAATSSASAGMRVAPARGLMNVDYGWNHHRWHHRHWRHDHWHYWD